MGLKKLTSGQFFDLGGVQRASAILAWDGNADCDLVLGLAANNQVSEMVYFEHPTSQNGVIRLARDKKNGFGLAKADESAEVYLAGVPHHINEVPVGVIVQGGLMFGSVSNARLVVHNSDNGQNLCDVDLDQTFGPYPAGKVGEFKRVNGIWRFAVELRGYPDIDLLANNLAV